MQFDPSKAPAQPNPNMGRSQKVIDEQIILDKANLTKAKRKLGRRFERNFNKWREYDLLTCLIAFVGLALAIVDWEYTRVSSIKIATNYTQDCLNRPVAEESKECNRMIAETRLDLSKSNFVRMVIVLVSIFGIVTLYYRHVVKTRWLNEDLPFELLNSQYYLNMKGGEEIEAAGFKRRVWFRSSFWWEAFIFLICPIPFKDMLIEV